MKYSHQVTARKADLKSALCTKWVTIGLPDNDSARDVARVCSSLRHPFTVEVCGHDITMPISKLKIVRQYLSGNLDPCEYRDGMPTQFYGWRGDIYTRQ